MGEALHGWRITVRSDSVRRDVSTYGGEEVNSDPVWGENFTVSDLLADEYEILVLDESGRRTFHEFMRVEPYRVIFVEIAYMSKTALARDLSPSSDKRDSQMLMRRLSLRWSA